MNLSSLVSSSSNNIDSLVAQYMALERRPITDLESQRSSLNSLSGVYDELSGKLSSLGDIVEELGDTDTSVFRQYTVTSSDTDYLSATVDETASEGIYSIGIDTLAAQHIVSSDALAPDYSGASGGTFTIQDGLNTLTVMVSDGYALQDVADAINSEAEDQGSDIRASVILVSANEQKLLIEGAYGASNTLSLDDTQNRVLQDIGVIVDSGNIVKNKIQDAADASFTVNGLTVIRSTNEDIDDVITGVTLQLHQETTSDMGLEVTQDTASITSKVESFTSAFNETIDYIQTQMAVDVTTYTRGALAGQTWVRGLRQQLLNAVIEEVSSAGSGDPSYFSEIGITLDSHLHLSILDSSAFEDQLTTDPQAVEVLFNSSDGVATRVQELLEPYTGMGGMIDDVQDTLSGRMDRISDRIEALEARLSMKEAQLREEFTSMQQTLNLIIAQQSMMQNILASFSYGMG